MRRHSKAAPNSSSRSPAGHPLADQPQVQRVKVAFGDLGAAGARARRSAAQVAGLQQEGAPPRRARWYAVASPSIPPPMRMTS